MGDSSADEMKRCWSRPSPQLNSSSCPSPPLGRFEKRRSFFTCLFVVSLLPNRLVLAVCFPQPPLSPERNIYASCEFSRCFDRGSIFDLLLLSVYIYIWYPRLRTSQLLCCGVERNALAIFATWGNCVFFFGTGERPFASLSRRRACLSGLYFPSGAACAWRADLNPPGTYLINPEHVGHPTQTPPEIPGTRY